MVRGVLDRLTACFSKGEDAVGEKEDETQLVHSVLDASVRYAHGGTIVVNAKASKGEKKPSGLKNNGGLKQPPSSICSYPSSNR